MASKSENRRINLYINGKEVQNNIKSIKNEYFKLINEQAKMIRGSKDYYEAASKIKQLQGMINEHNKHLGKAGKAWQSIKQIMYGVIGGNILTSFFQKLAMAIPNLIGSLAKLSDSFADVAKTTGLTMEQVKDLHKEFKTIDTRSSRKELLELARVAGKLGITGKKDIFDFVKAADQIKVALSEDLGGNAEDAINHIGKLVDVFKLKDKFSLEESMLKTGSAINALGAASTASEGYLVEFSKRVAGVAPLAKISIENVLGLAATLDQLGQQSEVSSTVYSQVVPDMFKDTATYAEVAGMKVDDFANLLNTDANEAFIKVLEGLNGNNSGLQTMVEKLDSLGIEGKRSIGVLGVLSNNTELLRDQQKLSNVEFEKGTSLTEEFNKKNENMAANLEKIGKWINGQFMSSGLMTFFENMVNKAAEYVKIPVSETMEVERIKVNALAIEMTNSNITAERRNEIYTELQSIAPDVVTGIDKEAISVDILRGNLAKYNDEMIKKIAIQESEEELSDKRKDYGKVVGERAKAEIELANELFKLKEKASKLDAETAERMNDILLSSADIVDKEKEMRDIFEAYVLEQKLTAGMNVYAYNAGVKVKNLREKELGLQEEMNSALKVYTDLYNKVFSNSGDNFIGPPAPPNGNLNDASDIIKTIETLSKELEKLKKKRTEINIEDEKSLLLNQNQIETLERLIEKYNKIGKLDPNDPRNSGSNNIDSPFFIGPLDPNRKPKKQEFNNQEISSIIETNKQKQEAYKEAREQIIIDLDKSYQHEASLRAIAYNEELESLGTNQVARKALDEKFKKDEAARLAEHLNKVVKQVQDILSTGGLSGLGIEEAMLTDEEKDALLAKIDELKVKVSELNAEASEKRDPFGMTESDWDILMVNVQKAADIAYQLGDIWNSINQRISNEENANLANYEKNSDKRKKALEDQLKKGLISQKKYNDEIATIDAGLDAEKKKLEIEQAKRFRTLTIFQILASGAQATINALNTQPFVLGLVMAALAAAATVAAIAAVPPVPAYAEGGFTQGDKVYRAGEKGKEWIAPNWMAEHPYIGPVIRDLESIRSGRSPESVFRSPVTPTYESNATGSGSSGSYSQNATQIDASTRRIVEQNDLLLKYLTDPENRKAYIKWDDLSKYSKEIQTMQELSGF